MQKSQSGWKSSEVTETNKQKILLLETNLKVSVILENVWSGLGSNVFVKEFKLCSQETKPLCLTRNEY